MTPTRCARLRVAALLALALLMAACQREQSAAPPAQPTTKAPPAAAQPPAPATPAAREEAERPELRIATLDGATWDLAAQRGQWVVINFWATWCAPCLKEMPELSALDAMREDVGVIGLAYEEIDAAAMRDFLAKRPVVYPIAIVDTYDPPAAFETPRGLPMTYLIAPDGRVAEKFLGPVTAESLQQAIVKAGGAAPAKAGGAP